jgi:hypothetical protein
MDNLYLLLRFTLAGDTEAKVRGAARITVDGRGGLVVYDAATGQPERISLDQLQSVRIDRPPDVGPPNTRIN